MIFWSLGLGARAMPLSGAPGVRTARPQASPMPVLVLPVGVMASTALFIAAKSRDSGMIGRRFGYWHFAAG